jgi:hypothetical protein
MLVLGIPNFHRQFLINKKEKKKRKEKQLIKRGEHKVIKL